MPLYRCSVQQKATLAEHYAGLLDHPSSKEAGEAMIAFIEKVNEVFPKTEIWALTSHYFLNLRPQDDHTLNTYVVVMASGSSYSLEYLLPPELAPWPNAYVQGNTPTLDQAIEYLKIAMVESRGWTKEMVI